MIREAITETELQERFIKSYMASHPMKLIIDGGLPLFPSFMKDMEIDVEKAYHVTDISGLNHLIKSQGKRNEIPCFTKGGVTVSGGELVDGDVLTSVKGKSSFHGAHDMGTILDKNGHRWILPQEGTTNSPAMFWNDYFYKIVSAFEKKYKVDGKMELIDFVSGLKGKDLHAFYKFYYKLAKKHITTEFITKIIDQTKKEKGDWNGGDEILIHKNEVISVWVIIESESDYEMDEKYYDRLIEKAEEYAGKKYRGTITKKEVEGLKV